MNAKEIIRKEYKNSKNFMTPTVLEIDWIVKDKVAYEISKGKGFEHETIYGLSVVKLHEDGTTERCHNFSDCYCSRGELRRKIESIRKELETA